MINVEEERPNLPPEVLKQLRKTTPKNSSKRQDQVVQIVKDCGGNASLDQIIVGFYTMFKEILSRDNTSSIIHNMKRKKLIEGDSWKGFSVLGKEIEKPDTEEPEEHTAGQGASVAPALEITCANCERTKELSPGDTHYSDGANDFCKRQCADEFKAAANDDKKLPSNQQEKAMTDVVKCANCAGTIPEIDVGKVTFVGSELCSHQCRREFMKDFGDE